MKIEITDKEFNLILCCLWEGHDFNLHDKLKQKYLCNPTLKTEPAKSDVITETFWQNEV